MSILKEKAKFNLDAAELLKTNNLFAPSVHCSYYSCLQLMKATINEFKGISYDQLKRDIQHAREKQKLNTHTYVIKYIGDEIYSFSKEEFAKFNRNIKQLKIFREVSDYEEKEITFEEGSKALRIAREVRDQMKKIFNV